MFLAVCFEFSFADSKFWDASGGASASVSLEMGILDLTASNSSGDKVGSFGGDGGRSQVSIYFLLRL